MASASSDRTARLRELFESVTGQSTVTERRQAGVSVRFDGGEGESVSTYVQSSMKGNGLDDTVSEPETQ